MDRAKAAQVTLVETDGELADQCDIIFSVVPPRDAIETAQRIIDALPQRQRGDNDAAPLYFADMNAVSPSTCRRIASMFESSGLPVRLIDGSIIGGPPSLRDAGSGSGSGTWYRPHLPTSGPHELKAVSAELASALGARHISDAIGAASGLKMCFASMSKGYSAIATQAYTTAYRLGVLEDLRWALGDNAGRPERSITLMPPKAYRVSNKLSLPPFIPPSVSFFVQSPFRGHDFLGERKGLRRSCPSRPIVLALFPDHWGLLILPSVAVGARDGGDQRHLR